MNSRNVSSADPGPPISCNTARTVRTVVGTGEVHYFVLSDGTKPYFLARVRWPDVSEAISQRRPLWLDDPGLFDLPYDPSSHRVTPAEAAAIANGWGAQLPTGVTSRDSRPSLIRRMPASWSIMSPAEKLAWSLENVKMGPAAQLAEGDANSWRARWRRRRRTISRSARPSGTAPHLVVLEGTPEARAVHVPDMTENAAS